MIEEYQQVAPDLLPVKGGLEPLLQLLAREPRQRELAESLVARQPPPTFERFAMHLVGANRQADEQVLGRKLADQELQHVPRRRVRPLNIVEYDDEQALLPCGPHVLG